MKRQKIVKKRPVDNKDALVNRLGSTIKVSRDFKPWSIKRGLSEAEVVDFLCDARDAMDPDANYIMMLLDSHSLEELIVEGLIKVED
jgi:hypothetical protein